mmetsp:Transcript_8640/g.20184  ORF Transcript_8640/g.20184 Transcript_8640/m.20184 type:complete len:80 (+) Transcript_8640:402-641(+)
MAADEPGGAAGSEEGDTSVDDQRPSAECNGRCLGGTLGTLEVNSLPAPRIAGRDVLIPPPGKQPGPSSCPWCLSEGGKL